MNIRVSCAALMLASFVPLKTSLALSFDVPWSTIDCGGGTSSGGVFEVSGNIGQPDAGPGSTGMTGGNFQVIGGFWVVTLANEAGDCNANGIFDPAELAEPAQVYWTNQNADSIQRANPDGTDVQNLVVIGLQTPDYIAVDPVGGKMYWSDRGTFKLQRANIDGSNVEDLLIPGLTAPSGVALDVTAGKLYWTDDSTLKIQRANLDGTGVEDLVTTGLSSPRAITLDLVAGKMYWTDSGANRIQRANLDGSNVETLVSIGVTDPRGIAVDPADNRMYWVDNDSGTIRRANMDGSGVETIVAGLVQPIGLALDPIAGKIYWADSGTSDKIQRANLDGTNIQNVYFPGTNDNPRGVAVTVSAPDCDSNGVPDDCDPDADNNGTPDACESGVPAASLTAAISRKTNSAGPGGVCDLPLIPARKSDMRRTGVSQVRLTFDVPPGAPGANPVTLEQATCAAPAFVPYIGASSISASVAGNELVLTFTPDLENARTYRVTLGPELTSIPGQTVEVRGLVGDVNSDGAVNALDRSGVVGAWTAGGFSCATDANNDGRTNAIDRSIVVAGWTSGQNCAP